MSSQTISPDFVLHDLVAKTWESIKPNFAALFVVCLLVWIWSELSPIWMPCAGWLISLLAPVLWFVGMVVAVLAALLLSGFGLAALGLLFGGTIPNNTK